MKAPANRAALVLMGGGARTAYQVGVLMEIADILAKPDGATERFPFDILVGTSAGALNATFLASHVQQGCEAMNALGRFWSQMRSHHVYRLHAPRWARWGLLAAGWVLAREVRQHRSFLDNLPLVDTLHKAIHLPSIETALNQGQLHALAVTASSYSSGNHWTFFQLSPQAQLDTWTRIERRSSLQRITIEHLIASSAIPFIFRSVPLWVDDHREYFGDGSMRQSAPLSPAIHLGAQRILAIGVGQPARALAPDTPCPEPLAGRIAGHAMSGIFYDALHSDVERAQHVNQTLNALPEQARAGLPYRPIDVLAIHPSRSLDAIAMEHVATLPQATRSTLLGLGALQDFKTKAIHGTAALASYLLFEPAFVQALVALGRQDARQHADALRALLGGEHG
jgi:NTE family protein